MGQRNTHTFNIGNEALGCQSKQGEECMHSTSMSTARMPGPACVGTQTSTGAYVDNSWAGSGVERRLRVRARDKTRVATGQKEGKFFAKMDSGHTNVPWLGRHFSHQGGPTPPPTHYTTRKRERSAGRGVKVANQRQSQPLATINHDS